MYMLLVLNIGEYLRQRLSALNCHDLTRAYIVSIFEKQKSTENDYSTNSMTILYAQATEVNNFALLQNLADWIFFCQVLFPNHLRAASNDYYNAIAQGSYHRCHQLLNRQLDIYHQLSEEFPILVRKTKQLMPKI